MNCLRLVNEASSKGIVLAWEAFPCGQVSMSELTLSEWSVKSGVSAATASSSVYARIRLA